MFLAINVFDEMYNISFVHCSMDRCQDLLTSPSSPFFFMFHKVNNLISMKIFIILSETLFKIIICIFHILDPSIHTYNNVQPKKKIRTKPAQKCIENKKEVKNDEKRLLK